MLSTGNNIQEGLRRFPRRPVESVSRVGARAHPGIAGVQSDAVLVAMQASNNNAVPQTQSDARRDVAETHHHNASEAAIRDQRAGRQPAAGIHHLMSI